MPAPTQINENRIRLDSDKFLALTLRALHKLTYKEIGLRMKVSEKTAYQRVQRALEIIYLAREREMRLCKK